MSDALRCSCSRGGDALVDDQRSCSRGDAQLSSTVLAAVEGMHVKEDERQETVDRSPFLMPITVAAVGTNGQPLGVLVALSITVVCVVVNRRCRRGDGSPEEDDKEKETG
jgi:hypothetical protein